MLSLEGGRDIYSHKVAFSVCATFFVHHTMIFLEKDRVMWCLVANMTQQCFELLPIRLLCLITTLSILRCVSLQAFNRALGGHKKSKFLGLISSQVNPIPFWYLRHHVKYFCPNQSGSAALRGIIFQ